MKEKTKSEKKQSLYLDVSYEEKRSSGSKRVLVHEKNSNKNKKDVIAYLSIAIFLSLFFFLAKLGLITCITVKQKKKIIKKSAREIALFSILQNIDN